MAIVNYDLKKDGRAIKQKFDGVWQTIQTTIRNGDTTSTFQSTVPVVKTSGQVVYIVDVDNKYDSPIKILQDRRLPQLGANYVENGIVFWGVYYVDATPRFIGPVGSLWRWEITYNVGGEFSNAPQQNTRDEVKTLLNFNAKIELEDVAAAVDLDGNWNANSIGDMFSDPLIYKNGILCMTYNRREYVNPLAMTRDFFQKVNASAWYGFAAGTVKVDDISFTATETTEETYYDITYLLKFRPAGWNVVKANSGLYCMVNGVKTRALNSDGSPTENPVLLALDGTRLPAAGTVAFKSFRMLATADFAGLDLPDPFVI